ncbi:hypothetical protein JCM3774_004512 [Rhodotorula dairenensis]
MDALTGVKNPQQIAGLLSAYLPLLARDGNPYAILRATLRDAVLLPQSAAAKPLYVASSIGAAIDVLLYVAVWVIRLRKNSFWLVRKAQSQDNVYWVAHSSLLYSCLSVLMCLGLQGYAWCVYKLASGIPVPMAMYWVTLAWIPGLLTLVTNCYVMGTTYILHLRSYADQRAPRIGTAYVLLGTLIATAVAVLASSLPPAIKSAKAYSDTMLDWMAVDDLLAEAASRYTGTSGATYLEVANSISPQLFDMVQGKQSLYFLLRFTFLLYAAWGISLGIIFCVVGLNYVRALKRSLGEFKDKSPTANLVFSQTLRNLIALLLGFTLFLFVLAINSVWVGILSDQLVDNGTVMQLSSIIPLLAAVLGTSVIALIMLYQALTAPTVLVHGSPVRPSTLRRSVSQQNLHKGSDLAGHYTRFALAASEFFPADADLMVTGAPAAPFEDLELQPASGTGSVKSADAVERQQGRGGTAGIAVLRQAVTVVSLPREGCLDDVADEKY